MGVFGQFKAGPCSMRAGKSARWTTYLGPWASISSRDQGSTPGLPGGLVGTHLTSLKMPPKPRHCCSVVILWPTPFFCCKADPGKTFHERCHWHTCTPWPQAGWLGEHRSAVCTRKKGADRPVLAGCLKHLSCSAVLARPGCAACLCQLEAAATALE